MAPVIKRIVTFAVVIIVLFGLLFLFGVLMDIRQACIPVDEPTSIGVAAASDTVMVEAISLGSSGITVTNGASEVEGYQFITSTKAIYGELLEIVIDYAASISTTTDVTITHAGLVNEQILKRADSATDGVFAPRRLAVLNSGGSTTYEHVPFMLQGTFLINVGQTTPETAIGTVYIKYRK